MLFSLLPDVNTINVQTAGGDTFVLKRTEILKKIENAAQAAPSTPENFAKFAEEIESVPPAKPVGEKGNDAGNNNNSTPADGDVIYSSSIVISPSTKVKHPKTGEMVAVGPYAEQMGVSQYLNKSIHCTIKKTGSIYLATATCGGSVIYSQPLETEAEVKNAIAQIKAFS